MSDFAPLPQSIVKSFGVVSPSRRDVLRPLVFALIARVRDFESQCGVNRELYWMRLSMEEAFDRLSYPSTYRDLVRQVACVQRTWLYANAWLEFHVTLFPEYRFIESGRNPPTLATQGGVPNLRTDLMGGFTTFPNVAQKLFMAGVPVWFMRDPESLTYEHTVVDVVPFTEPDLDDSNGFFSPTPVYTGPAGEKHITAITFNSHAYCDLDPVATDGIPESVAGGSMSRDDVASSGPSNVHPPDASTSATGRIRDHGPHRFEPCKYI